MYLTYIMLILNFRGSHVLVGELDPASKFNVNAAFKWELHNHDYLLSHVIGNNMETIEQEQRRLKLGATRWKLPAIPLSSSIILIYLCRDLDKSKGEIEKKESSLSS